MEYNIVKDDRQLLNELEYEICFKRENLTFTINQNFSRLRDLRKRQELFKGRLITHMLIFVVLLIVGVVFAFLINIGHSFVTSVFSLIYLFDGIIYMAIMIPLFIKIMELFMRWLENSETNWGNEYCEKHRIFTLAMEQTECARQITKYQNYLKILEEIEDDIKINPSKKQLETCLQQIQAMEIEPVVPKGKTRNTREENIKYTVFFVLFVLLVLVVLFCL